MSSAKNAGPRLTELEIADDPEAWERAGFAVVDGATQVGHVRLRFVGTDAAVVEGRTDRGDGARGIRSWSFAAEVPGDLDGVVTGVAPESDRPEGAHANGVTGFDHVVLMSPDAERTTNVLTDAGFVARGVREFEMKGTAMCQTFFWMGEVILELVGPANSPAQSDSEPQPAASLWGLAFMTPDLDATVATLGELSSEARTAVQPGRRIASLRHKDLDVTVPVAFMTPHVNVSSTPPVKGG